MGCGVSSFCPPLAATSFASVAPAKAAASRQRTPDSWAGSSGASPHLTPALGAFPTSPKLGDSLHHRYTLFGSPIFRSASCQDAYRALFITMSQDGETLVVEQYIFPPSPDESNRRCREEAEPGWSRHHRSYLEISPPASQPALQRAASLPELRSTD